MRIDDLLKAAVVEKASDLHLTEGISPMIRLHGQLKKLDFSVLTAADTEKFAADLISEEQLKLFKKQGELDFSYVIEGLSRFRIHVFQQRGTIALAIRTIDENVPTLHELGLPVSLANLTRLSRGLVLVTGPTGSGKSTTLAALIHLINTERAVHIITLEDPIEYLHKPCRSIVHQRQIYRDTPSFPRALRAALREDPDVISVGEMRDMETMTTVMTAAETGHLVFATLHTSDTSQTLDRMIDGFPPYQQQQIRNQLSLVLQAVISQQLLPMIDKNGRVVALEILLATPAVRSLIREGKTHQILSVIQTSGKTGMQSMDMDLARLYRSGVVTLDEVKARASDPETWVRMFNR